MDVAHSMRKARIYFSWRRRYLTLNRVELSRAAVIHNVSLIKRQYPGIAVIPVLKSNAYGHGLSEIAAILNDTDVPMLAVDGYFEAAALRHVTSKKLLVLGYIQPENTSLIDAKQCSYVVQDEEMLRAMGRSGKHFRIHIELNTGMNRLGLTRDKVRPYLNELSKYSNLKLEGILSHLADADNDTSNAFTNKQVHLFDQIVGDILELGFDPTYIHIAQTAGSVKAISKFANALRLGIGLYGINPLSSEDKKSKQLYDLKPVLCVKSKIIKVNDLQPGDAVGYNVTFRSDRPMRIGVLPIGYYEGVPRSLSNVGIVLVGARQLRIVGRVSMNHTMIELPDSELGVGDEVTVISANPNDPNAIATIATQHDLFSYNLVTAISPSIRRVVV